MFDDMDDKGIIWISEFDSDAAAEFHVQVLEKFKQNPTEPIVIYINSPGGSVTALLSMMNTMDTVRAAAPENFKFVTCVMGEACSAGADLLAYGDVRVAAPTAQLMFHELSDGVAGKNTDVQIYVKEMDRCNEQLAEILYNRSKFPGGLDALRDWLRRDAWITPKQAKAFGFIDAIGYLKVDSATLFRVQVLEQKEKVNDKKVTKADRAEQAEAIAEAKAAKKRTTRKKKATVEKNVAEKKDT